MRSHEVMAACAVEICPKRNGVAAGVVLAVVIGIAGAVLFFHWWSA